MSRFSRIKNGQRYNEALNKYKAWQSNSYNRRNEGVGTRGNRPAQTRLSIEPFGMELAGSATALASAATTSWSALSGAIGSRAVTNITTATKVNGFKPARVIAFYRSGGGVAETSKITGMKYLKYNGQRHSAPFGRSTSTDLEYDAFKEIAAAIKAGGQNRNVSYQPEVFRAN